MFEVNRQSCIGMKDNYGMSTFGERLKQARKAKGLSQAALGKLVGVKQATISEAEAEAKGSSKSGLMAEVLGVSPAWLIDGKPPMYESTVQQVAAPYTQEPPNITTGNTISMVPLISWVQAGEWSEVTDYLADDWIMIGTTYKARRRTFALIVEGESMLPKFPEGVTIIVEPDEAYGNGSYVIVRQNGDKEATFKQLVIDGGKMYLKALNPDWPKRIIEMMPDAVVCGVVKRMEIDV